MQGKIENGFRILSKLGIGTYAVAYLAINMTTNEQVVIKKYFAQGQKNPAFSSEMNNLVHLSQNMEACEQFAVCFKDAYFINNSWNLVMNYIKGDTVEKAMDKITKSQRQEQPGFAIKLIFGLNALHNNDISHQDIKI